MIGDYSLIDPKRINTYLISRGWAQCSSLYGGAVIQLRSPDGSMYVHIPFVQEFYDYEKVVARSVSDIARYYELSESSLMTVLETSNSDVLKWRIKGRKTMGGMMSMDSMYSSIRSIKDLLFYAGMDIVSPSTYHPRQQNKEVESYLSQYSFGQTEVGSYVLTLICPLGEYEIPMFEELDNQIPFLRRVNLKIFSEISKIQESVENGTSYLDESISTGRVSVNFLDSLCSLYEENQKEGTDMELSPIWDCNLIIKEDDIPPIITFKNELLPAVSTVADRYRNKEEQNVSKTFYGKISEISSDPELIDRETVRVVVVCIGDDKNKISLNVYLDYKDNIDVVNKAFSNGLDVKVSGIYSSSTRIKKLEEAYIKLL